MESAFKARAPMRGLLVLLSTTPFPFRVTWYTISGSLLVFDAPYYWQICSPFANMSVQKNDYFDRMSSRISRKDP
jgi:hypothetical protein